MGQLRKDGLSIRPDHVRGMPKERQEEARSWLTELVNHLVAIRAKVEDEYEIRPPRDEA